MRQTGYANPGGRWRGGAEAKSSRNGRLFNLYFIRGTSHYTYPLWKYPHLVRSVFFYVQTLFLKYLYVKIYTFRRYTLRHYMLSIDFICLDIMCSEIIHSVGESSPMLAAAWVRVPCNIVLKTK